MTFQNTAWAIDGALLGSDLARRAEYAAVGGAQGVVNRGDLKVSQLAVPGVGVKIAAGVGLIANEYQGLPNETYVVSNPAEHTIPSGSMPASNPAPKSYILAVVVGDPDFSQAGHPWMVSPVPVGEEQTYSYVRPTFIEVAAGVTELSVGYPALPIARIDVPASTTTITDAMIVDLTKLARPRRERQIFFTSAGTWSAGSPSLTPSAAAYAEWGSAQYAPTVKVPSWASRAILSTKVNGIVVLDTSLNIAGGVRGKIGTLVSPVGYYDLVAVAGTVRLNVEAIGAVDVSTLAGTTTTLKLEGYESTPAAPTTNQHLRLDSGSQVIFDIEFLEE